MLKKLRLKSVSKKLINSRFSVFVMFLTLVNMSSFGVFFIAPEANATIMPQMCAAPVDVVIIMDRSGSMTQGELGTCIYYQGVSKKIKTNIDKDWCVQKSGSWTLTYSKFASAKSAASTFVDLLKTNDQSALVSFANNASLDKGLSNGHPATKTSINALVSGGSTNIGDAIKLSNTELSSSRSNPQAVKVAILLTDGMANKPYGNGSGEDIKDVDYATSTALIAANAGYKIFTIGLGSDVDSEMLQKIASSTNAQYYFAPSVTELAAIYTSISQRICQYGSISGTKYIDANNDGIISGESTSSDWTINLNGAASSTQKTNSLGKYVFSGLLPGTYTVSEGGKIGVSSYTQTYPALGNPYTVTLTEGQNVTGKDFGNYIASCGNSVTDSGEQCDAGAQNGVACTADYNGTCNYCSALCQNSTVTGPYCGDNTKNGSEECDNVSGVGENQSCSATCTIINLPYCGDNSINQSSEQCDGNEITNGTCNSSCQIICSSEYHLNDALTCEPNTPDPFCGDSNIDTSLGEECDAGLENGSLCSAAYGETCNYCTNKCKTATLSGASCGDGVVDSANGEECDDNNLAVGDGCNASCKWETNNFECSAKPENSAWNTVSTYTQSCQASNGVTCTDWSPLATSTIYSLDATTNACHFTCSDGYNWNGNACVAILPICGNELTETGEQCDDGNVVSGDGCSASCTIENNNEVTYGWNTGEWGSCSASCGSGTQTRVISCINNSKEVVADSFCNSETKPTASQSCNTQSCGGGSGGGGGGYVGFAITNPQITMQCVDSKVNMTMTWLTSFAANSRVVYDTSSHAGASLGSAPNYSYASSTLLDASQVTGHSVAINGLNPNTAYYFRPISAYNYADVVGEEKPLTQTLSCGPGSNPSQVIVLGEEGAPILTLTNTTKSTFVNPGAKGVEFELTVTNKGNLTSFETILKDVLPAGLSFSDDGLLEKTWNLGDLAVGETRVIKVKVDVAANAPIKNYVSTASVRSSNHELISSSAGLDVRKISVLAETGFSWPEFTLLLSVLSLLIGSSFFLKSRINDENIS